LPKCIDRKIAEWSYSLRSSRYQKYYSFIILSFLSDVTSERCPSPWLCAWAHTSRLQQWQIVGNVWEI